MSGVNKVMILGNCARDPETRFTPSGVAVCNLTVATSESWRDQQGQRQERAEWHRIVAYRKLAEIIGEYVRKGSKIYIEGKLQTRKWQDKDGQDRYTTEIIADEMQMLDGRQGGQQQEQPQQQPRQQPQQQRPAQSYQQAPEDEFIDDIPSDHNQERAVTGPRNHERKRQALD